MFLRTAYWKAPIGATLRHPSGKWFAKLAGMLTEDAPGYNPDEDAARGYQLLTRAEMNTDDRWAIVEEWAELGIDPSL